MSSQQNQKPEITYPCRWEYKVIGADDLAVKSAVQECLERLGEPGDPCRSHQLEFSRASSKGKYLSFLLALEVQNESERDGLFRALSSHPSIFMVI